MYPKKSTFEFADFSNRLARMHRMKSVMRILISDWKLGIENWQTKRRSICCLRTPKISCPLAVRGNIGRRLVYL